MHYHGICRRGGISAREALWAGWRWLIIDKVVGARLDLSELELWMWIFVSWKILLWVDSIQLGIRRNLKCHLFGRTIMVIPLSFYYYSSHYLNLTPCHVSEIVTFRCPTKTGLHNNQSYFSHYKVEFKYHRKSDRMKITANEGVIHIEVFEFAGRTVVCLGIAWQIVIFRLFNIKRLFNMHNYSALMISYSTTQAAVFLKGMKKPLAPFRC